MKPFIETGMYVKGFGVVTAIKGDLARLDNGQWLPIKYLYNSILHNMSLKDMQNLVKSSDYVLISAMYEYICTLKNPLTGLALKRFRRHQLSQSIQEKINWLHTALKRQLDFLSAKAA